MHEQQLVKLLPLKIEDRQPNSTATTETTMARLKAWVPLIACGLSITTIILCFIISQSLHHDTGGLTWPYISDTGRDRPEHIIFAIGLTLSAVLYVATWKLVVDFLKTLLTDETSKCTRISVIIIFGMQILAGIGLALLSIFDTRNYPTTHLISAVAFFVLAILGNTMTTIIYWKNSSDKEPEVHRRAKIKLVILIFTWLLFLIYIPIGLPLAKSTYVEATKLYDYSEDVPTNTMRSVTQFFTVICLLLFMGSWTLEFRD
eukprot:m.193088 g.193088  ORF g.193088 m.193088 type:complete len:260 (-) comp16776_c10_seq6:377-1156(-)